MAGFVAVSATLLLIALLIGWDTVEGLRWPFDTDLFRNIANAVTFKDGGVLSDAHYSGVPAWYSPLTSALLGFGSLVTSVPVHRLATQGGVLLNLVTPVALCFVTARWFGRRAAVLTLVAYLFVIGDNYPSWAVASYSPWLFVNIYATGLFILALAATPVAVNRGSIKDALVLGIVGGIVVLAHPASAILLAAIAAVQFLGACRHAKRAELRRLGRSAGISLGAALVVSAPFWLPIMIRYQWQVVNPTAATYSSPALDVHHVWRFLRDFAWQWPALVLVVGLPIWFLRRRSRSPESSRPRSRPLHVNGVSILTAWTVLAFVAFLLEVYRDSPVVGRVLLPDAPSHHYLLAFTVALCMWFGIALNAIVQAALGRFERRWGAVVVVVVVAAITAWTLPSWRDRTDLVAGRAEAEELMAQFDDFAVVEWIRDHTDGKDVFLNVGPGTWNGVLLPGLAGRKSVNLNISEFSNPFVNYGNREQDQKEMVAALQRCDLDRFRELAREHGRVRYVITQPASTLVSTCSDAVPIAYSDDAVSIQRIEARSS